MVALAHLAVTAVANVTSGYEDDEIGPWLLLTVSSAAAATLVWIALGVRVDTGRPGWKRLPRWSRVDPDSLPRRSLRWRWLLWYAPLWAAVTLGSLLLTPGVEDPFLDLVLLTLGSGLVQVIGVLAALVVPGLLALPVVLLVVGARRFDDGDGLPATGPVLVATGLALLMVVPWAVAVTTLGGDAPWSDGSGPWPAVAVVTSAVLLVSLVFVARYALGARDRDARRADGG